MNQALINLMIFLAALAAAAAAGKTGRPMIAGLLVGCAANVALFAAEVSYVGINHLPMVMAGALAFFIALGGLATTVSIEPQEHMSLRQWLRSRRAAAAPAAAHPQWKPPFWADFLPRTSPAM